jgi:transposase
MSRFIVGRDRHQVTLLPKCLDVFITEDNKVRMVNTFVSEPDRKSLGFDGVNPAATGCRVYHPAAFLMLYLCGYLNRMQSSPRLDRERKRGLDCISLITP